MPCPRNSLRSMICHIQGKTDFLPSFVRFTVFLPSNGKIDKRALRDLALAKIEATKEKEAISKKAQAIKAEFYNQGLYKEKSALVDVLANVSAPLPVYQAGLHLALPEKASEGVPSSSSSDTIDVSSSSSLEEKGNFWDGYQDDVLPEKTQGKLFRNFRHQVFSLYRRLFGVVFIVNMAVLIWTLVRGLVNAQHLGLVVVANLFCAILMRQDYVINTFFTVFCAVPSS